MKSSAQRKISVTLPDFLVEETDLIASSLNRSRSELMALAVKQYVGERKKIELKEQMKKGYLEMGRINLSLAEDSLLSDESAYKIYEEFLSESE
mgnify:CR=1 FL=1